MLAASLCPCFVWILFCCCLSVKDSVLTSSLCAHSLQNKINLFPRGHLQGMQGAKIPLKFEERDLLLGLNFSSTGITRLVHKVKTPNIFVNKWTF